MGDELNEIDKAINAASNSELAILVLGENEWQKENEQGTSGEGYDVPTFKLTGRQK